jgi:hypothetical protein
MIKKRIRKAFEGNIYLYDTIEGRFWRHIENNTYIEVAVKENNKHYPQIRSPITGTVIYAHRLAWLFVHGDIPEDMVIDHINGDVLDYSIQNLRLANKKENARNKHGVYKKVSKRYPGKIYYTVYVPNESGKSYCLGNFKTKAKALTARRNWERWHKFHQNHGRKAIK